MKSRTRLERAGSAYILAILLVAVFVAMAAALASTADMNARMGNNLVEVQRARWAAESGMNFAVKLIRSVTVPSATTDATIIANLAASLSQALEGTANLGGQSVTHDASTVYVPSISLGSEAFQIRVVRTGPNQLALQSHGTANNVTRVVAMDLVLTNSWSKSAFSYGVASYGPITIAGDGQVRGMNQLTEASVISATNGPVAISLGGNAVVDGDVSSTGTGTSVVITGSPTIAGSQDPVVMAQHIHFGVNPPVFPEIDTTVFRDLDIPRTVIDKSTNTGTPGMVFDNPLIKAGTNPTFSSDVVLNGVVYVEAPNIVTFTAKVTLNGMVATEQSDQPIESCKLSFTGQLVANGISSLPDLPQYEEAKALDGTFIVAPSFDVSFTGQFTAINGTIAADKLSFSGEASGTVEGSVIGLQDTSMYVGGEINIIIDRSGEGCPPPGFSLPLSLDVVPRSYREVTGPEA